MACDSLTSCVVVALIVHKTQPGPSLVRFVLYLWLVDRRLAPPLSEPSVAWRSGTNNESSLLLDAGLDRPAAAAAAAEGKFAILRSIIDAKAIRLRVNTLNSISDVDATVRQIDCDTPSEIIHSGYICVCVCVCVCVSYSIRG